MIVDLAYRCDSVEHPTLAHVAGQIPAIVPVGPDLAPGADIGLPESVLNDAEVIAAALSKARVQREGDTVGLGTEVKPQVDLLLGDLLLEVPHVDLVSG